MEGKQSKLALEHLSKLQFSGNQERKVENFFFPEFLKRQEGPTYTLFIGHSFVRYIINLPEIRSLGLHSGKFLSHPLAQHPRAPTQGMPSHTSQDRHISQHLPFQTFMFAVLERKRENRDAIAQVCRLLHVLEEKKSHGGTKAPPGSPTHNIQDCTGTNRRNHSCATTLAFIFVIFKVHVLYQLKRELLLGTSSVKIRDHFNSSPCAS